MLIFFSILLGLSVGSFINALVWRVQTRRTLRGRSICPRCKKTILVRDLIPVVSYILLKGRCRVCKKRIALRYPIVEVVTAAAFVWAVSFYNPLLGLQGMEWFWAHVVVDWVILFFCIALFALDAQYGILPDVLTIPALFFSFITIWGLDGFSRQGIISIILGSSLGALFFAVQWFYSHGRWVGDGDIRLGAVMGAMLGFPAVLIALLISYTIGSLVGIGLLLTGVKKWQSSISLGPFLIIGLLIVYYSPDHLLWLFGF